MKRISVVIPCYKVKDSILELIKKIGVEIDKIYIIDDCCPENSGKIVANNCTDPRVHVMYNKENLGVGGSVVAGYKQALKDDSDIIVKIDGDGQMDPDLIPFFTKPIAEKLADYTKGNRFFHLRYTKLMPIKRILGNLVLSFATKISSGYWNIFDPTNGYTAINASALRMIDLDSIDNRYFFESDMLFRLGTYKAVVMDIAMKPLYPDHNISHFNLIANIPRFIWGNVKNTFKRIIYNYYVRDFNISSIELLLAIILLTFGVTTGLDSWNQSISSNIPSTAGTVMLSALPIIIAVQLLLSFINYDMASVPRVPLSYHMKDPQ